MFNEGHFLLYGLGWFLKEYSGHKIVSHTGGVNGFVTSVTLIPEENAGIIVLTNTDQNNFFESLKWEIIDALLGNLYRNYSKVHLAYDAQNKLNEAKKNKALQDSVALQPISSLPLIAYTGNYYNEVYGNMSVVYANGRLLMKFSHHPDIFAKLESLGGNRFYATFNDPEFGKAIFPFTAAHGKIKSVRVKVADFIEYNFYDFIKK